MCECEFDPYPPGDGDYGEESWHYLRTCLFCGKQWWGLHCPHDGCQNPCPGGGRVPEPVQDDDDGDVRVRDLAMVTGETRDGPRATLARPDGKYAAQLERRAWRARERAAHSLTPAGKVAHRGGRVEEGPKAKPRAKAR